MTESLSSTYVNPRVLKINVGFMLAEGAGYSRLTEIDVPDVIRVAEDVEIQHLKGRIQFTRTSEGILLQGDLSFQLAEVCSRCLTPLHLQVPLAFEELFGTQPQHPTAFHVGDDNILDLAPLIREEKIVSIPSQVLCKPDCLGLCPTCGENRNEGLCECDPNPIDPRWAALAQWQARLALSEDDASSETR